MGLEQQGFSITSEQLSEIERLADEWDEREARQVGKSDVARVVLSVGLSALAELERQQGAKTVQSMTDRQRRETVKQAIIDHFRDEE